MNGVLIFILVLGFVPLVVALWTLVWNRSMGSTAKFVARSELLVSVIIAGSVFYGVWLLDHPQNEWGPSLSGKWLFYANLEGAEIWINGVCLGRSPVITTEKEFYAKIPTWDKPPADFEKGLPHLRSTKFRDSWDPKYKIWRKMDYSDQLKLSGQYYVQIKYAGEFGLWNGGMGAGSRGSKSDQMRYFTFGVLFPQREARLKALFDLARLNQYQVTDAWFQALDTYHREGYLELRRLAKFEVPMRALLDGWASWKYRLNEVRTADDAWRVLQQIGREADQQKEYFSGSLAGHAVEMISDRLDPNQVEAQAEALLESFRGYISQIWKSDGQYGFGVSYRFLETQLGDGECEDYQTVSCLSVGGSNYTQMPPRVYVTAHAVWQLWQQGRGREMFQERLAPRLIAWFADYSSNGSMPPLQLAAGMGGAAVDQFLQNQKWKNIVMPFDGRDWWQEGVDIQGFSGGNARVNRWFYLRMMLNDEAGVRFRAENSGAILQLYQSLLNKVGTFVSMDVINFITSDRKLAMEFYPQFVQIARQNFRDDDLAWRWRYLQKINAEAQLYVDAFNQTDLYAERFNNSLWVLDKLDRDVRTKVIQQLVEIIHRNPELKKKLQGGDSTRDWSEQSLTFYLGDETERTMRDLIDAGTHPEKYGASTPFWITKARLWFSRPNAGQAPVVAGLLGRSEPILRELVIGAIRGTPDPTNLQILQKLKVDPDAKIREEALQLERELHDLAGRKPGDFVSEPGAR